MKNYVQPGDRITIPAAPYEALSGAGLMVGNLFGVAAADILNGGKGTIVTCGVFDLKKTSAQAWATVGLPIYWDDNAKECTTDDDTGANQLIGVNVAVAANPSGTGRVRLGVVGLTA